MTEREKGEIKETKTPFYPKRSRLG